MSVNDRFLQHISHSKRRKSQTHFYRALRKYGSENFTVETLYESNDADFCLNIMEPYFIRITEAIQNGYNLALGGAGNKITSNRKPVDCYDKNGHLLFSYKSMAEAARDIGVPSARISMSCKAADNNRGSQVDGKWFSYSGKKPIYKMENPWPGLQRARVANTGQKRPEHGKFMKEYHSEKDIKSVYTFIHSSGLTFKGSRRQLIAKYSKHKIDNIQLGCMIRGLQKTCRGWSIA